MFTVHTSSTFYACKNCKVLQFLQVLHFMPRWLGWAMVLGSFQCQGVLLLLHIVGQGPAVLTAGVGQVGYDFLYFSSIFHF